MAHKTLTLPPEFEGLPLIASVSGGKDSTALILALREAGLPFRAVFADTGWEAPETYAYLDTLRERLGLQIDVVGVPGGMLARATANTKFPARLERWCTRQLKVEPLRDYHNSIGDDTVNVVGMRAEESEMRAKMLEVEDEAGPKSWGGWVWRPLLTWTVEDVLRIHNRHSIPVNPLYHLGFSRVGCFPCIFVTKSEIALIASHSPQRIDEIAEAEAALSVMREERNAETPGRYKHTDVCFFQTKEGIKPMGVRKVVEWSRTSRGGKQLPLFAEAPRGGCMRWGLCDMPAETKEVTL